MRRVKLGTIDVDAGDCVVFSHDALLKIMRRCRVKEPVAELFEFVEEFGGVNCDFASDGEYAVEAVDGVGPDGSTYNMALIGGPRGKIVRFLVDGEHDFNEYIAEHPDGGMVGFGPNFDRKKFASIMAEFKERNLRPNKLIALGLNALLLDLAGSDDEADALAQKLGYESREQLTEDIHKLGKQYGND